MYETSCRPYSQKNKNKKLHYNTQQKVVNKLYLYILAGNCVHK